MHVVHRSQGFPCVALCGSAIKDDFEFIARQHDVERVAVVVVASKLLSYSSPSELSSLTQIVLLLLLSSLSIAAAAAIAVQTSKRALQLTACTIQMMRYSITFQANTYKCIQLLHLQQYMFYFLGDITESVGSSTLLQLCLGKCFKICHILHMRKPKVAFFISCYFIFS